jgi:ATPase subunit of ABC transporter with duplicated ATPase domains
MSQHSSILLHHINYTYQDNPIFTHLTYAFGMGKMGLVGRKGIGKTTLLRLLLGELLPDNGNIQRKVTIAYCPQDYPLKETATVGEILGISEAWQAYPALQLFELTHLSMDQLVHTLSGGQRTRLLLARCFTSKADFLILDEPTNNLDSHARQLLYCAIQQWPSGLLVVSHDRALLNLMDAIIELNTLGLHTYGGNYEYYQQQKSIEIAAIEQEYVDAKKELKRTKQSIQSSKEQHAQKRSKGEHEARSGKVDKLTAKSRRGRSERTQSRMLVQENRMLVNAQQKLTTVQEKLDIYETLDIALPNTYIPAQKRVLQMENINFGYKADTLLFTDFNLIIQGPERIVLTGSNGSGKSTLFKLIQAELAPDTGTIYCGVEKIAYLSQHIEKLDETESVLNNFLQLNPDLSEFESRSHLAQFLFRNKAALQKVSELSGGKRLRAALACLLCANNPPQLLLLDEPTNHLDLESIAQIEAILKHYQGALIISSHEQRFLQNIGCARIIKLGD